MAAAASAGKILFTSEAVTEGCPDKLCDRISDAVLDACLAGDQDARVSCEACTKSGMVMILGEVVTKASVNYEQVIREALKAVGYDSDDKGLDWRTSHIIVAMEDQGADLAQTMVGSGAEDPDLSVACGYATDETPELMPLSHALAARLVERLDKVRKEGTISWAHPFGTAQVVLEYTVGAGGALAPSRIMSVAMSVQHAVDARPEKMNQDLMEHVVKPVLPDYLCNDTVYRLDLAKQPLSGSGNVGMTGRRIGDDTYGGWGCQSSASLSGKDGSKLTYATGSADPVAISVDSYGTSKTSDAELAELLKRNFDFKPSSLRRDLDLKSVQFQKLSAYGHMGRTDVELPWEKHKKELK